MLDVQLKIDGTWLANFNPSGTFCYICFNEDCDAYGLDVSFGPGTGPSYSSYDASVSYTQGNGCMSDVFDGNLESTWLSYWDFLFDPATSTTGDL